MAKSLTDSGFQPLQALRDLREPASPEEPEQIASGPLGWLWEAPWRLGPEQDL